MAYVRTRTVITEMYEHAYINVILARLSTQTS